MRAALFAASLLLGAAAEAGVEPHALRVEHLRAPVGLDVERPRLSWSLRAPEAARGQRQTAYRIVVASTPERLTPEAADVWDSGRVVSDAQHLVPYGGPALQPGRTYHWAVRAWDRDGESSAWAASAWTTGRPPSSLCAPSRVSLARGRGRDRGRSRGRGRGRARLRVRVRVRVRVRAGVRVRVGAAEYDHARVARHLV